MKTRFRNFAVSALLFVASALPATIVETKNFSEIYQHLQPKSLVVLDIDDTLLIPEQMLGNDEWFKARWKEYMAEGLNKDDALELALNEWQALRYLSNMEIVEPGTDAIVKDLQEKGYKVMCLTTQGVALASRTSQQLHKANFDVTKTAPSLEHYYSVIDGVGTLYREGILFTANQHKGKALFTLLDKINYTPEHIIFVNDKRSHILPIEDVAAKRGVPFVGLRYGYSDYRKDAYDHNVATYQFTHSSFTHILSDQEVEAIFECGNTKF